MFPEVPRVPQQLETMFEADTPKRFIKAIGSSAARIFKNTVGTIFCAESG